MSAGDDPFLPDSREAPEAADAPGMDDDALAQALGVSSRHLARLSLRKFGFAPKLLLRRQRFLRTLQELRDHPGEGWASLIDAWYYDQSHFVRDIEAAFERLALQARGL